MKRLAIILATVACLLPAAAVWCGPAWGADIILIVDSNWSTCFDGNSGGAPPAAGDTISLNGKNLRLDGADASTYTCVSIAARVALGGAESTGTIVLANAISTINANITAGTNDGMVNMGSKTLTVNGTAKGGSTGYCIVCGGGSTGTLTVTKAEGGDQAGANGAHGVYWNAGATSVCTVGTAKGGTVPGCMGVHLVAGILVLNGTDLSAAGYPVGTGGTTLKVAAGVALQFSNAADVLTPFVVPDANYTIATGGVRPMYTGGPDGNYVEANQNDHRNLTAYGSAALARLGNLVVPPPAQVLTEASYDSNAQTIGTFSETSRNQMPQLHEVLKGVTYKEGDVGYVGTRVDANAADVRAGVKFANPLSWTTGIYTAEGGGPGVIIRRVNGG